MNPTHPLCAIADFAAQAHLGQHSKRSESTAAGATISAQYETGSQDDSSLRRQHALVKCIFPRSSHERRKTVAKGGVFRANRVRRISVDVRCAHLDPRGRGRIDTSQRLNQDSCGLDSRPKDFVPMIRRLDAINASASEVDQTGGFVQLVSPRPQRPPIPRSMLPRTVCLWHIARENHNRGSAVGEVMGEGDAEETAAAGDDNFFVFEGTAHGIDSNGNGCRGIYRRKVPKLTVIHDLLCG